MFFCFSLSLHNLESTNHIFVTYSLRNDIVGLAVHHPPFGTIWSQAALLPYRPRPNHLHRLNRIQLASLPILTRRSPQGFLPTNGGTRPRCQYLGRSYESRASSPRCHCVDWCPGVH